MQDYLNDLAEPQQVPVDQRVRLEQLGRAKGGVINPGVRVKLGAALVPDRVRGVERDRARAQPAAAGLEARVAARGATRRRRGGLMEIVERPPAPAAALAARAARGRCRPAGGLSAMYHVSPSSPHLASRADDERASPSGRTLLTSSAAPTFQLSNSVARDSLPSRARRCSRTCSPATRARGDRPPGGYPPEQLVVLGPSSGAPPLHVPIADEATAAAGRPREPYRVVVSARPSPPLIYVQRERSASPAGRRSSSTAVRETIARSCHAEHFGPARRQCRSSARSRAACWSWSPSKFKALLFAAVVFGLWCAGLIVVMGLLTRLAQDRSAARDA